MAFPSLCTRCALKLQRSASAALLVRPFSSTTSRRKQHGLPTFAPTSSPELDSLLLSLRTKHLIPSSLSNSERRLIFGTKYRQQLADNPQTVTVGDEDIQLEWIDRRTEVPNRRKLVNQIIELMSTSQEKKDWDASLPGLLVGLKRMKKTPDARSMAKIVRLAVNSGRFGTVLQCLRQARHTGMTLKEPEVLEAVIWGLRQMASEGSEGPREMEVEGGGTTTTVGWKKENVEKALRDANEIAMMLEDEEHGSGRHLKEGDPRTSTRLLSVYLELSAVYAYIFQDGKDLDGKVMAYTQRLISNITADDEPESYSPEPRGPQTEVLRGVPLWHGLTMAKLVLCDSMPDASDASDASDVIGISTQLLDAWSPALRELVDGLKEMEPKEGSYAAQAIRVYEECEGYSGH